MLWPEPGLVLKVIERMCTPAVALATKLESVSRAGLIPEIVTAGKVALPKEFTRMC